jgi:hypothetical protein
MRDDSTGIRTRVSPWAIRWVAPTAAILRTFLVAALLCLKPSLPAAWAAAPESNKAAPISNKAAARSPAPAHDQRAKASQLKPRRPESGLPDTIPPKVYRYAEALVRQYDRNRDGVLDAQEWQQMHGNPALADADRDGAITLEEMVLWIVKYGQNRRIRLAVPPIGLGVDSQADEGEPPNPTVAAKPDAPAGAASSAADDGAPDLAELEESRRQAKFYVPSKRLPAGLPAWFLLRDEDGDGQLTLGEFAPKPTPADLRNFEQYDLNGDGLITPKECLRAVKSMKPSAKKPPTK